MNGVSSGLTYRLVGGLYLYVAVVVWRQASSSVFLIAPPIGGHTGAGLHHSGKIVVTCYFQKSIDLAWSLK